MAAFSFSVGDILAVGKLIGQVTIELRENGEAASDYQALLIELENLKRALGQLQTLKPAKHELAQLTAIRAVALACQLPLQEFLGKISKFEKRLGTFNATNNKWKGFPRRMQFKMMFDDDVKQMRSALANHVATINLLLMTQSLASTRAAEEDRNRLESKIIEHEKLIKTLQQEVKRQFQDQSSILDELGTKADSTCQHLNENEALATEAHIIASQNKKQTRSILATVTTILARLMTGLMHLRRIARQLHMMTQVCGRFTAETRIAMSKLMELFLSIQTMLQRIDRNIPTRLYLPTVQFTTALGETMVLPYQLCQHWTTFEELLKVIFRDKPGKNRVYLGRYLIMNARGGRILTERSWQHVVNQDDHLSMSMVLDELEARVGSCPFPTCQASTEDVEANNGGRTCVRCGRWSLLTSQETTSGEGKQICKMPVGSYNHSQRHKAQDKEDIEVYRQIQVWYSQNLNRSTDYSSVISKGPPSAQESHGVSTNKWSKWSFPRITKRTLTWLTLSTLDTPYWLDDTFSSDSHGLHYPRRSQILIPPGHLLRNSYPPGRGSFRL